MNFKPPRHPNNAGAPPGKNLVNMQFEFTYPPKAKRQIRY